MLQAILVSIVAFLAAIDEYTFGASMMGRPLFTAPIISFKQITDNIVVDREIRSGISDTNSRKQRNAPTAFIQKDIFSGRRIQVIESRKIAGSRHPYRQMSISKLVDICLC